MSQWTSDIAEVKLFMVNLFNIISYSQCKDLLLSYFKLHSCLVMVYFPERILVKFPTCILQIRYMCRKFSKIIYLS